MRNIIPLHNASFYAVPVDSFTYNLVKGKETLIQDVTQFFTPQKAIKQELELRNLPPLDLLRFDGNPVHWPEFIDNFLSRDS